MYKLRWTVLLLTMFFIMGTTAGCDDINLPVNLVKPNAPTEQLTKVKIQFTDQKEIVCYVKSLGVDKDAQVYIGGPSSNFMYDKDGNIIGSFNYQRVIYMSILSEGSGEE